MSSPSLMSAEELREYKRLKKREDRARRSRSGAATLTAENADRAIVEAVARLADENPDAFRAVLAKASAAFEFAPGAELWLSRRLRRSECRLVTPEAEARAAALLAEHAATVSTVDPALVRAVEAMSR